MLKYIKQGFKEASIFSAAYLEVNYPGYQQSMDIRKKIVEDLKTSIFYVNACTNSHDYPIHSFASLHNKGVWTSDAKIRTDKFIGKTDTEYINQISSSSGIICYQVNFDGTVGKEGNYLNLLDCCISFKSHAELLTDMENTYFSLGELINHVKYKLKTFPATKIYNIEAFEKYFAAIDESLNFQTIDEKVIYSKLYNNCDISKVNSDIVRRLALNSNI